MLKQFESNCLGYTSLAYVFFVKQRGTNTKVHTSSLIELPQAETGWESDKVPECNFEIFQVEKTGKCQFVHTPTH